MTPAAPVVLCTSHIPSSQITHHLALIPRTGTSHFTTSHLALYPRPILEQIGTCWCMHVRAVFEDNFWGCAWHINLQYKNNTSKYQRLAASGKILDLDDVLPFLPTLVNNLISNADSFRTSGCHMAGVNCEYQVRAAMNRQEQDVATVYSDSLG